MYMQAMAVVYMLNMKKYRAPQSTYFSLEASPFDKEKNIAIQKIKYFVLYGVTCTPSTLVLQQLILAEHNVPQSSIPHHAMQAFLKLQTV